MNQISIISKNWEHTLLIGYILGKLTRKPFLFECIGELGSGKTSLIKGYMQYFGNEWKIKSPTFNIFKEYSTFYSNIYHIDLYRLNQDELNGFYNALYTHKECKSIIFIEWAPVKQGERNKDALFQALIVFNFLKNSRLFTLYVKNFYFFLTFSSIFLYYKRDAG
ncbi:MAG: tRNA (adenosine(37)-N6)-threonylcarbamoyltransferase complex ATPase subunit type 1 TsaE [Deltaproteobacteria bacterium]|nr:MAG: tRNA (adenosine(37)-N6)-threonylcarbamoyltransferase complex ATPase subunit type 1 TsaE [Deltaproteobacteria bacterium]